MKAFIIVVSILFFVGCESIDKTFSQKTAKEKCDESPCTDSLCLHWNDFLQRCGTETAFEKELTRKKVEIESLMILSKDSVAIQQQKQQLEKVKKNLEIIDSLSQEIICLIKENKKKADSIWFKTRFN